MWSLGGTARLLFQVAESPNRVATAFALGIFIAFFPILGIHTAMAVGLAMAFRLNKVAVLAGAWTNNPWTLGPMYTAGTLFGCMLTGVSPASIGGVDWTLHGRAFYASLLAGFRPLVLPFVLGNLVFGVVGAVGAFFVLRSLLNRRSGRGRSATS